MEVDQTKRILALDGGGSRGLFTIQILKKIEALLPDNAAGEKHTLNSYFDLMAGTSTGAIIATLLRWGFSLDKIEDFYLTKLPTIFSSRWRIPGVHHVYLPDQLKSELQREFGVPPGFVNEKVPKTYWKPGEALPDSTMGSKKLQGYLMVVTMRADTLSPWIQTNHPDAPYNDLNRHDCNLQIPLWQLIRAGTAAPYYFPPQRVWFPHRDGKPQVVRGRETMGRYFYFVDGAISGYNNPAHIAYRMATLPEYYFGWETGIDKLKVISVGTGDYDSHASRPRPDRAWRIAAKSGAEGSLTSLMALSGLEQDMQCRIVSRTLHGHWIDRGVGNLQFADPRRDLFTYARYQKQFSSDEIESFKRRKIDTKFVSVKPDSLKLFVEEGQRYAEEHVKPEHLV
ncbi:MAG: patatin-like phospholipase family protein [Verrucomicrobiales bacterium]|nr:patatin-like phospholipase family protein [Verrucomicrobiales bacterium]